MANIYDILVRICVWTKKQKQLLHSWSNSKQDVLFHFKTQAKRKLMDVKSYKIHNSISEIDLTVTNLFNITVMTLKKFYEQGDSYLEQFTK